MEKDEAPKRDYKMGRAATDLRFSAFVASHMPKFALYGRSCAHPRSQALGSPSIASSSWNKIALRVVPAHSSIIDYRGKRSGAKRFRRSNCFDAFRSLQPGCASCGEYTAVYVSLLHRYPKTNPLNTTAVVAVHCCSFAKLCILLHFLMQ